MLQIPSDRLINLIAGFEVGTRVVVRNPFPYSHEPIEGVVLIVAGARCICVEGSNFYPSAFEPHGSIEAYAIESVAAE